MKTRHTLFPQMTMIPLFIMHSAFPEQVPIFPKAPVFQEGEALAYLIAPPLEAMYGVDAALKAADVKMCVLYAPPSETNFGGALLTGSQSACKAACDAFAAAVEFVAENPRE